MFLADLRHFCGYHPCYRLWRQLFLLLCWFVHERLVDDHRFHLFFLFVMLVGLLVLMFRLLVLFNDLSCGYLDYLLLLLLDFFVLSFGLLGKLLYLF